MFCGFSLNRTQTGEGVTLTRGHIHLLIEDEWLVRLGSNVVTFPNFLLLIRRPIFIKIDPRDQ